MSQEEKKDQNLPIAGRKYRHYKGGVYEVIAVALDADNYLNNLIVYKNENGVIFTRSVESWNSKAEITRFEELPGELVADEKTINQINQIIADITEDLKSNKVNEYGFSVFKPMERMSDEDWQRVLNSNEKYYPESIADCFNKEVSLKRVMDGFTSYRSNVTGEVIEAKVLGIGDADYTGETLDGWVIGYVYGPSQKNGKVKEHYGKVGVDYLIKGDHYVKVMKRDKFVSFYENVHPL